ncbi:hypothetical protein RLEG12_03320 (plasmid) [Rhizobium leguminosarum bv. trifolii CB782]|nr:hypothetical protein RLEG12_03320 [Rhizobium leguminosarum bv. trifolii CB782]
MNRGNMSSLVTQIPFPARWRYFTVASRSDWKKGCGEATIRMG